MRLLIITQKVDRDDPVLGFFHGWIAALSRRFDSIIVICLEEGKHALPANVRVVSLGKETEQSRSRYISRFYASIWQERNDYDVVFVHMNQEYVLLGGWLWKCLGKKVYMWRNHQKGSFLTDIAMSFCTKVFCTSRSSYTAKSPKAVIMPVGIDTDTFKPDMAITRKPHSILFLSRMAPVKRPDLFIETLALMNAKGVHFTADLYGDPLPKDEGYYKSLNETVAKNGLSALIAFRPGVPNSKTPALYSNHEVFVNLTESGSYDKTILEAMACGCIPFVSNNELKGIIPDECIAELSNPAECAIKLETVLSNAQNYRKEDFREYVVQSHSLNFLVERISGALQA